MSTIIGVAIGRAINNSVTSQDRRSNPSAIQPTQQAIPTPIAQDSTQVQPVSPRVPLPEETPVQAQPNSPTQTGKCINPDDVDSRGKRCGRRSAYSKGPTTDYDSNR